MPYVAVSDVITRWAFESLLAGAGAVHPFALAVVAALRIHYHRVRANT